MQKKKKIQNIEKRTEQAVKIGGNRQLVAAFDEMNFKFLNVKRVKKSLSTCALGMRIQMLTSLATNVCPKAKYEDEEEDEKDKKKSNQAR